MDDEKTIEPSSSSPYSIDELYVREYLYSTGAWDDFDTRCLTIKGWTAAGGLAAVVAVLGTKELLAPIMGGAVLLVVSLWLLDAQWRIFQHSNHNRIVELEKYFAGTCKLNAPFQCHTLSAEVRKAEGWKAWWRELRSPLVFVPYLPLVVLLSVIAAVQLLTPTRPEHPTNVVVTLAHK